MPPVMPGIKEKTWSVKRVGRKVTRAAPAGGKMLPALYLFLSLSSFNLGLWLVNSHLSPPFSQKPQWLGKPQTSRGIKKDTWFLVLFSLPLSSLLSLSPSTLPSSLSPSSLSSFCLTLLPGRSLSVSLSFWGGCC